MAMRCAYHQNLSVKRPKLFVIIVIWFFVNEDLIVLRKIESTNKYISILFVED